MPLDRAEGTRKQTRAHTPEQHVEMSEEGGQMKARVEQHVERDARGVWPNVSVWAGQHVEMSEEGGQM